MSQALRKLAGIISKSKTILIFINQTRQKIGIVFGNPETTTGGTALKFYSSVRIDVRRAAQIKQGDKFIGNRIKAKIVKNKVAPPFRITEFDIMFDEGISISSDVLDTGAITGVIKKSGNTYSYGETKFGVGHENAKKFLKENPKLIAELKKKIFEAARESEKSEKSEVI
jgi:recombination protein RecA